MSPVDDAGHKGREFDPNLGQSRPQALLRLLQQPPQANVDHSSSGALVHRNEGGSFVEILRSHSDTRVVGAQVSELDKRSP